MRWKKLGRSENVERRRGSSGGGGRPVAMGGGLGMIIMALIAIFVFKVDPSKLLEGMGGISQSQPGQSTQKPQTAQQAEIDEFVSAIKSSTEQEWTQIFKNGGQQYRVPKMVNYDGMTRMRTGGVADARMGPFYLPAEETIYLDTAFFGQMQSQFKAGGDFAYAYVIAHEVGHHVQKLLGRTDYVHKQKGRIPDVEYNRLSVRLELQADFLAGVWAHHADNRMRTTQGQPLLEKGDIEEAMRAAKAIGDDALQRQAGGQIIEDSFTHGTSEQRLRWFMKGFRSGNPNDGDTFAIPYNQL
ncbi:MAG: KPN_02809 family neutral zinc metallopeptidase [Verrucomicrobiaceae bacterium]